MNGGALRSIVDRVKHNGAVLGLQRLLSLDVLVQLNQLLGDSRAEQVNDNFAVGLRDGLDLWLIVRLIEVGMRNLAVKLGRLIHVLETPLQSKQPEQ